MSDIYYEIIQWKTSKGGKKYPLRLGSAKANGDGGFFLNFDAYPAGEGTMVLQPEKPRQSTGGAATKNPRELEDGIPF